MIAPCPVKAYGMKRLPPRPFEITICDLKKLKFTFGELENTDRSRPCQNRNAVASGAMIAECRVPTALTHNFQSSIGNDMARRYRVYGSDMTYQDWSASVSLAKP